MSCYHFRSSSHALENGAEEAVRAIITQMDKQSKYKWKLRMKIAMIFLRAFVLKKYMPAFEGNK